MSTRIGLVSIQKNRAPWLHEWVAFHHLVGFSKFYIYAHNCTDHSDSVLNQLSSVYDLKAFRVGTHENQVQLKAYQHAYEQFGHECDWLAFIDGDEFLFPTAALSINEALAEYDHVRTSAIGAYWVCFGSGGHVEEPSGLVIQNYRRRPSLAFEINRHVKSIVRGRQATRVGPNSHTFVTPWGTQDELGRPIDFGLTQYEPSYTRFRINHYVTQSLQFFKQFKQTSGAADAGANYVRPDSWWAKHDHNDELDSSLVHLVEPLRREMARVEIAGAGVLAEPVAA
ncbi:MAG: glycosyltransferase family 2 protein [Rubrivivax sp.]|nr:glycosyltransferase family 2 protein [Rubrivivax sp.]